jgi:hypothetical protein
MQKKLLAIINVDFYVKDQLLIRYPVFVRHWRKNGTILGVGQGQVYDPGEIVVQHSCCLNKTDTKVCTGKNLTHFLFRLVQNMEMLFNFASE